MSYIRVLTFFSITVAAMFFSGCKKEFPNPKKKVVIDIISESTALPGEVSIFFQVYDKRNSTPIAGLVNTDFVIYEQGPNDDKFVEISASEANSSIVLDNQNFVFSTMLVLDLSASVTQHNLEDLKSSAITFINEFMPENPVNSIQMGVWWFDGEQNLHQLQNYTSSKIDLTQSVNSISASISNDPSTNLYGAIVQSTSISQANSVAYDNLGILNSSAIVVFTDGTDQAAWNSEADALNAIESSGNSIKYLTIGLGDEIDKKVLKNLGSSGFAFAKKPSKLNEVFEKIGQRISDEANSYYLFRYCSPKRNGDNIKLKLEINAKVSKQKHKGKVETSFDATGFTGC